MTVISQYSPYNLLAFSLKSLATDIQRYLENELLDRVCAQIGTNDVVCDLYVYPDFSLKIIEFNSFEYWLASVLFDWLSEHEKLYNENETIYVKVLV